MKRIIKYSLGIALLFFQNAYAQKIWRLDGNSGINSTLHFIGTRDPQSLVFKTQGTELMRLEVDGKVGIGTTNFSGCTDCNQYRLFVKDGIKTDAIRVSVASAESWADYVFRKDYRLYSLEEMEKHIKENKYLPNIPSAEEAVKNGIDLGKMDAKLLEKIEELTLYTIDLSKKNTELDKKNTELNSQVRKREEMIRSLLTRVEGLENQKQP